jgi:hypothetical protein
MNRFMLTTVTALAALAAGGATASAQDYPFCLQGKEWGYPGLCYFLTYQQCMASASGTNAYCGINPRFAFERRPQGGY